MKKQITISVMLSMALSACSTASKDITPSYISPLQYQAYDCDQLSSESQRLQVRANQIGGRLDEAASNDKAITGAGLILFWPALFALGGTKQQEAEYARLRGEHSAIEQSAISKKCSGIVAYNSVTPQQPTETPTTIASSSNTTPANPEPIKTHSAAPKLP